MSDPTRFDLDERQRAILAEMGVRVWWPQATSGEAPAVHEHIGTSPNPVQAPAPASALALETTPENNAPQEKFLGMPKKIGIGVTIGVGVLAIGLTTFFLLRRK